MTDTPTPVYGLRQQSLGSNTNTWGDDKLNDVIVGLAQIAGKIKSIVLTGDYTITSTNYVSTADNKNAGWVFTGTLTSAATITVPSSAAIIVAINNTTGGFSTIVKTSAGTGITVPNGRVALLWCDGVNVYNMFPTHMGTTFVPSLSGDAANVDYVDTAIANATIPAAAGTVLVSGSDTTAGYLGQKITEGTGIDIATQNPAANENLQLSVDTSELTDILALGGTVTSTFTSGTNAMTAKLRYRITGGTATIPTLSAANNFAILEMAPAIGTTVTAARNSQTINGTAEDRTWTGAGLTGPVMLFSYLSAGAVRMEIIGSTAV